MAVVALISGCAATPNRTGRQNHSHEFIAQPAITTASPAHSTVGSSDQSPATDSAGGEAPVRESAQVKGEAVREFGDSAAAELPTTAKTTPTLVDPGATRLINAMLPHIDHRLLNADDVVVVSIAPLRNQSHSTAREFNAFTDRLSTLLSAAGRMDGLRFTADANAAVDYVLLGTAYLITDSGFDQWELFLTLTATDDEWAVWRSRVRVLRFPREGQQQVFVKP